MNKTSSNWHGFSNKRVFMYILELEAMSRQPIPEPMRAERSYDDEFVYSSKKILR